MTPLLCLVNLAGKGFSFVCDELEAISLSVCLWYIKKDGVHDKSEDIWKMDAIFITQTTQEESEMKKDFTLSWNGKKQRDRRHTKSTVKELSP